jgi:hypothetical protein
VLDSVAQENGRDGIAARSTGTATGSDTLVRGNATTGNGRVEEGAGVSVGVRSRIDENLITNNDLGVRVTTLGNSLVVRNSILLNTSNFVGTGNAVGPPVLSTPPNSSLLNAPNAELPWANFVDQ